MTYQASGFIKASTALHAVSVGALMLPGSFAHSWPYALGALGLNHAALTAAGLWPRSTLLGSNWLQLPAQGNHNSVALTLDDGPNPVLTPQVLGILKEHNVQASFFCIGQHVAAYPALAKAMVDQGHALENHSHQHAHTFSLWGPKRMAVDIAQAQAVISNSTGRRPQFFRAPAGLRNPFLDYVLQQQNLQLAAWTRRGFDTRCTDPAVVLNRLLTKLAGRDILLAHDHNSAVHSDGTAVILKVLPRLLEAIHAKGLRCIRLDQAVH
jgi:peptidoglycan-N-acetylglucosamine deacetylase